MSKQYALATIQFQANARQANAAIESLRQESVKASEAVTRLKDEMKQGMTVGKYNGEELPIAKAIRKAEKDVNTYKAAIKDLTKGVQAFESVVKNMRAGTLEDSNAKELRAAIKAAQVRIDGLRKTDKDYATKRADLDTVVRVAEGRMKELIANTDEFFKRFKSGAVTSTGELQKQKKAMTELLATMDAGTKEYQQMEQKIATVDARVKELGGDYGYIRQNLSDTKKVSDEALSNMLRELQQVNSEGKVTQKTITENARAMREIRAEQGRRVSNVLGGDLGKQKEGDIRRAISTAKELIQTYGSTSRKAQELAAQIVNAEEHLKTVGVEAARNAQREKAALAEQAKKEKELKDLMTQRMQNLQSLTEGGLAETKKYWQAQMDGATKSSQAFKEAEKNLRLINAEQERLAKVQLQKSAARISRKNLATLSEQEVTESIKAAKQLAASMKPTDQAYKTLTDDIIRAEEHVKKFGYEGVRSAQQASQQMQTMRNHVQNLTSLSSAALAETQKYWQAQLDGATKGSKAYREAEKNLRLINAEQEKLTKTQLETSANKLGRANLKTLSGQDLQNSINAAKQLLATMKPTNKAYTDLQNNILRAEEFSKQFGLETARAAQQAAAKMQMMNDRMTDLKSLSAGALEETKRFWQAQMDGATRGSQAYTEAETHIKNIIAEQEKLAAAQAKVDAQKIYGNKMLMSEGAIRNAINAAKEYQQTLSATNPEYKRLSVAIVDAEEHIKKYGAEAERAARKEAAAVAEAARKRQETDTMMRRQLYNQTNLSQSALKAQEQYWQRLIDDPKTAQASIARYTRDLQKVKQLQEQMVQQQGQSALAFFRGDTSNASADQIKQQADALKKFRDSLPQQANAQIIAEIDGYLVQAGQAAQKASEQTMSFRQALQVSAQAGKGQFKGTVDQLNQAKKTLEAMQQQAVKGGFAWRRMQEGIERIEIELKNVGHLSKDVQAVLDKPKGKSFNELKQAVEQGRIALQSMRTETDKDKKAFDDLAAKIKAADQQMKTLAGSAKGTATAFDKAWSRLKTYIGLYMGAAIAIQKLVGTLSDLGTLSDKLGEVRKTTGFTADEVGRLSDNLRKLDVRTSLTDLMEVAAKAGQLGLKSERDVLGFTEAANKMMIALPEMGAEAATEMMKVATATGEVKKIEEQMKDGLIEGTSAVSVAMTKIASTIDQLRANSAAAAPQITDFVKRVGAVGAQSGISIDQIAALGATVDALGLRVEMSATALSRMIPAIRRNAFELSQAVGISPEALRSLFDAGRGMEAVLLILQHIKDQGLDAESIEQMLGMGGMQEIMKELNQQGARAGIVFAGLSQNVDELRKNLGIASEAYEENMAIEREYEKMNKTLAAEWEKMKNQISESFVSDQMQRIFTGIVKGMRRIVDFMTNNLSPALNMVSGALKTLLVMWAAMKIGLGEAVFVTSAKRLQNLGAAISLYAQNTWAWVKAEWALVTAKDASTKATQRATIAQLGWNKALKWNIIMAVVAALGYLALKIWETTKAVTIADKAFADLEQEYNKQINSVNTLFHKLAKLREMERLSAEQAKATAEAEKQKAEAVEQAAKAEQVVADTTKIITDSIKAETIVTDSLKKSKENLADTTSILNKGLVAEVSVTDSLEQSKKKLAEVSEILNGGTLKEVVVTGSLEKSKRKLAEATKLLDGGMLAEVVVTGSLEKSKRKLAEATDIINGGMLKEVVVTGSLEKSKRKLAETTDIINGGMLQEVVVTGSLEKSKRNLANTTATLNGGILQEVVVTGSLEKSKRKLAEATKILDGGMLAEVVVTGSLEKSKKKLAEATDIINGGMLKEVVVTGSLEKSKRKLAEVSKILDGGMLQEVVVTGSLEKAKRKLAEATDIINGGMLQEIVVTGSLEKSKKKLTETTEILDGGMLQEVVVTGSLEKSKKNLTEAIDSLNKGLKQAVVSEDILKKSDKELTDSASNVTKSTQAATEATGKLSEKSEELAKQSTKVEEGMHRVNIEGSKSAEIIRTINSKYGTYLGYMLSETSSAEQLAAARELINKKLRETITLKQQEAALGNVETEYGGKVNKKASKMEKTINEIFGDNYEAAARVSVAISEAAQKYAKDEKAYNKAVEKILKANAKYFSNEKLQSSMNASAESGTSQNRAEAIKEFTEDIMDEAKSYRTVVKDYQEQVEVVNHRFEATNNAARKETKEAVRKDLNQIVADWNDLFKQYSKAEGEQKQKLAAEVYKQQRNYANAVANNAEYFEGDQNRMEFYNKNIETMKKYEKGLRAVAGDAIRTIDELERADTMTKNFNLTNNNPESQKNPWGAQLPADSTEYTEMNAEALVNRRKQMNDFVKAIQTDSDVQTVLKEDAALKKAIEKGMASDMRTVIEWYNTERLKIQDELHARHLTNTGDWMDPKAEKARKERLHSEWKAYIDELDAYYTERKARIQESYAEEGISEKEAQNRTIANEAEWRQRRMELQKMYAQKAGEVTEEEQEAIFRIISERTGDDVKFVKATYGQTLDFMKKIGEKSPLELKKAVGKLDLDIERDGLRLQQTVAKQVKAIQDIIDKERPFNGITKNLRENLETMDILAGHMRKEYEELLKTGGDMTDFNNRQAAEQLRELTFILGEAENAYSTTIAEVTERMRKEGMTAWADWLQVNPKAQEGLMAQLRQTYDQIQDAIKKEASQMKKQAEIMWNNILLPGGDGKTTIKDAFEKAIAQLGIDQGRVSRANSLIGAGQASERVADKLAIKQMQLQLTMQQHYYNLMQKQGQQRVNMLDEQAKKLKQQAEQMKAIGKEQESQKLMDEYKAKMLDKQHAEMSLNLATTKEQTDIMKQQEDIIARTEESQARLYKELREWGDLLASSMRELFEASNAGNAEYYNELAKLNLTGKGGPGAGTYIVIDNEGTENATAHYEYLDERQALERQREIEQENARAEAWKKLWDDINMKMSDQITDWLNASLQDAATRENTTALGVLTNAIESLDQTIGGKTAEGENLTNNPGGMSGVEIQPSGNSRIDYANELMAQDAESVPVISGESRIDYANSMETYGQVNMEDQANTDATIQNTEAITEFTRAMMEKMGATSGAEQGFDIGQAKEEYYGGGELSPYAQQQIDESNKITDTKIANNQKETQSTLEKDKKTKASTQSTYAAMASAMNMYGLAYQTMSNENMDMTQKFQMFALQAAGQTAIGMLTTNMLATDAQGKVELPGILGKAASQLGPIAGPIAFAAMTALLGGLMAVAMSSVTKAKSQISQVTGASTSAGRLSTGMLTYAEGNVNELTDPSTLTPGRQYNVDAADGHTYRARYMGKDARTHITNGPEFHLVGEKGREAIIDAHTTRLMQMDDTGIWQSIQTLYNGGSLATVRRNVSRRGVRAYADGNLDDFGMTDTGDVTMAGGIGSEQLAAFQSSLDRNNELLERALRDGIKGVFDVYGKGGLVDSYDTGKKTVIRHGERY